MKSILGGGVLGAICRLGAACTLYQQIKNALFHCVFFYNILIIVVVEPTRFEACRGVLAADNDDDDDDDGDVYDDVVYLCVYLFVCLATPRSPCRHARMFGSSSCNYDPMHAW